MSVSNLAAQHSAAFFVLGLLAGTDVKVRFGGDPCYQRPAKTIWLPNYPTLLDETTHADLQSQLLKKYRAIALHESGHPLFTSEERNTGKVGRFLWGALEDVRVDSLNQLKHAGAKLIFEQGYGELIADGKTWNQVDSSGGVVNVTCGWVLYRSRHLIAEQQCFADLSAHAHEVLVELVGNEEVEAAWEIVLRTRLAKTSAEVVPIVNDLLLWIKRQLNQQIQEPPSSEAPEGDEADQSERQEAPGDLQGESDSDVESSGDEHEHEVDAGLNPQPHDQPQQSPADESPSPDGDESEGDSEGAVAVAAPEGGSDQPRSSPVPAPAGNDGSDAVLGADDIAAIDADGDDLPVDVGAALASSFEQSEQEAFELGATVSEIPEVLGCVPSLSPYHGDSDTRPFSIRLSRLLCANSTDAVSYDRRGSRIDPQRLVRWRLGEREVFVDEVPARRIDTAVMVVVDESPSMAELPMQSRIAKVQQRPIEVARAASLRLCKALGEVQGISVSAIAFPAPNADGGCEAVKTLLPFGGHIRNHADAFLSLNAQNHGGTPLHLALTHARFELLRQSKPRRLCVVLTDGEPNGGEAMVRPYLDLMSRDGIEVIGVGIKTMVVKSLFTRHEVIQDLNQLEPALFSLLQSTLLHKRAA